MEGSLDVWEIIESVHRAGERDVQALATDTGLPVRVLMIALDYYSRFPEEIDEWIADNEFEAEQAYAAWRRKQAALV